MGRYVFRRVCAALVVAAVFYGLHLAEASAAPYTAPGYEGTDTTWYTAKTPTEQAGIREFMAQGRGPSGFSGGSTLPPSQEGVAHNMGDTLFNKERDVMSDSRYQEFIQKTTKVRQSTSIYPSASAVGSALSKFSMVAGTFATGYSIGTALNKLFFHFNADTGVQPSGSGTVTNFGFAGASAAQCSAAGLPSGCVSARWDLGNWGPNQSDLIYWRSNEIEVGMWNTPRQTPSPGYGAPWVETHPFAPDDNNVMQWFIDPLAHDPADFPGSSYGPSCCAPESITAGGPAGADSGPDVSTPGQVGAPAFPSTESFDATFPDAIGTPEMGPVRQMIDNQTNPVGPPDPWTNDPPSAPPATIPSCEGLSYNGCIEALQGAGFGVYVRASRDFEEAEPMPQAQADQVFGTTPAAGASVSTATSVSVDTNPGFSEMPFVMPDLRGKTAAQAREALAPFGWGVPEDGIETLPDASPDLERGPDEITQQSPQPNARAHAGPSPGAEGGPSNSPEVTRNPSSAPVPASGGGGTCGLTAPVSTFNVQPISQLQVGQVFPFSLLGFLTGTISGFATSAERPNVTFSLLGSSQDMAFLANFDGPIAIFRLALAFLIWLAAAWFLWGRTLGKQE